jgi:hypothetical protein
VNPSGVLTSKTVFDESLNAFGKRTAWEFPDLNTLAEAVVMRIYGRYGTCFRQGIETPFAKAKR